MPSAPLPPPPPPSTPTTVEYTYALADTYEWDFWDLEWVDESWWTTVWDEEWWP